MMDLSLRRQLMLTAVLLVAAAACSTAFTLDSDNAKGDDDVATPLQSDALNNVIMAPKDAKVLLRVKRGWIKGIIGEEEDEEEESERRRERQHYANLKRQCQSSCWGSWKPWGACSVKCGSSGIQHSYRDRAVSSQCTAIINQHGCPGSNHRTQACGRSCQNRGTLGATSCSCPAGFKGTCCEQRVTCPFPGKPANGNVSPASSTHSYNAKVTYSCNTGYRLSGSSTNQCMNSGAWKNRIPTCQRITCSKPSVNSHVSITPHSTSYDYGSRVVFSCADGYTKSGSASATCTGSGSWSASSPTCTRISCPALSAPSNGGKSLTDGNYYRSRATFTCSTGFHLTGSNRRTCQISGQWDGTQPTCTKVTCARLSAPSHGSVSQTSTPSHGNKAIYSCNSGYELSGNSERSCTYRGNSATGSWTGSTPTCQAVSCGQPSTPAHASRTGNDFSYGKKITFRCQPGYYLHGDETITCQANKQWSLSTATSCKTCGRNTYKSGSNGARSCSLCPTNTHTTTEANTQVTQCLCDEGYEGRGGGPCNVIKCASLQAPPNGELGMCSRIYSRTCTVHCKDGYIRHHGDETRTCLINKQWTGVQPTCKACPKNHYKGDATSCPRCPLNSETSASGSSKSDCVCKAGFQGPSGGPCIDINECSVNNGGCDEKCTNYAGTYKCSCDQANSIQDADNHKKCVAKNSCPALETPNNGGLVCVAEQRHDTERCSVKCNAGYQHILTPNMYEECGPSTNFQWSTELSGTPILGCMESYFDGILIDGEAAYFTTSCNEVSGVNEKEIGEQFINMLKSRGICVDSSGKETCSIEDITIACGTVESSFGRRKRSAHEHQKEVRIKFKARLPSVAKTNTECESQCKETSQVVLFEDCYKQCEHQIEAARKTLMNETAYKIKEAINPTSETVELDSSFVEATGDLYPSFRLENNEKELSRQRPSKVLQGSHLKLGSLELVPVGIMVDAVRSVCDKGMQHVNESCVPCPAGSYLSEESICRPCKDGFFQPQPQQETCHPCYNGKPSSDATQCIRATATEDPMDFFVFFESN